MTLPLLERSRVKKDLKILKASTKDKTLIAVSNLISIKGEEDMIWLRATDTEIYVNATYLQAIETSFVCSVDMETFIVAVDSMGEGFSIKYDYEKDCLKVFDKKTEIEISPVRDSDGSQIDIQMPKDKNLVQQTDIDIEKLKELSEIARADTSYFGQAVAVLECVYLNKDYALASDGFLATKIKTNKLSCEVLIQQRLIAPLVALPSDIKDFSCKVSENTIRVYADHITIMAYRLFKVEEYPADALLTQIEDVEQFSKFITISTKEFKSAIAIIKRLDCPVTTFTIEGGCLGISATNGNDNYKTEILGSGDGKTVFKLNSNRLQRICKLSLDKNLFMCYSKDKILIRDDKENSIILSV